MPAQLLDGKALALSIKKELQNKIAQMVNKPGLAVLLVGQDPASQIYVKNKRIYCDEVGIKSFHLDLPENISEIELAKQIEKLNNDDRIDGILVQIPLPKHINTDNILEKIIPDKDVDGFHPYNLGRLAQRRPLLRPCTPLGIINLLNHHKINTKGMHAVVVGASNIVGRPMALELLHAGATVTICHRFTKNLQQHVEQAEVLVVAVGIRNIVKPEWVKPGCIVIDVGMHRLDNGHLIGDLDLEFIKEKAAWVTPVPGGVGPMTVATLLENTYFAAVELHGKE